MVKIIERHLTDSDVEWLNEPISYNPLSVHALMRSQGLTPPSALPVPNFLSEPQHHQVSGAVAL